MGALQALPAGWGSPGRSRILRTVCSQNAFGSSISSSLVSIAMSGKMKVNLYGIFRVQNGGPPKVGGPNRPNTSNMPKAGPVCSFHYHKQVILDNCNCHGQLPGFTIMNVRMMLCIVNVQN